MRFRDWVSERFQKFDHVLVPSVPLDKFSKFVQSIVPIDNGHNMILVGPPTDGSYFFPDDLIGVELNISPGVGQTFQFEDALLRDHGVRSIMLDASLDKAINLPKEIKFVKKFVVPINQSDSGISLSELISLHLNYELMLQMDIEGAEYEILKYINPKDLLRFRIMAIEFHDMELWIQNAFFRRTVEPIFDKLLEHFDVVYSRANNTNHTFYYKGYFIPSALEMTFHRKDRLLFKNGYRKLPSDLDITEAQIKPQKTPFSSR